MRWMLVVAVLNGIPIKTNLTYVTLEECLKAEQTVRAEYARVGVTMDGGRTSVPGPAGGDALNIQERLGSRVRAACIPHAPVPRMLN